MIGIIGGNGVAATNRLLQLIEEKKTRQGAFRDAHHPEMIVWQATQAPSRSMYLEGKGESFIPSYVDIGNKLKELGCDQLCMCCNTAHYAIDELSEKIGIPFINLMDEVAKKTASLGCKRALVMCTAGLRKFRLYESSFSKHAPNIEVLYPSDDIQELVTKGICNAKNSIRFENPESNKEHPYNCFSEVCQHYINGGDVDCIIAGCTDISNVFSLKTNSIKYIDSLDVLADVICENV